MSKRAEEKARKIYPYETGMKGLICENSRGIYIQGYEQAEKDLVETIKTAEDHAYFAGSESMREKVISLIESRISEILGDAQPAPILRIELQGIIDKIKEI